MVVFFSCAEKLMDKSENLISEEKMIEILNDLALVNAAKTANVAILRKHDINPTNYIFEKYNIDSLQFVESDRYYASIPEEHEAIYVAVEAKLKAEKDRFVAAKKLKDSLAVIERKVKVKKAKAKDSLLKNVDLRK